jgi:diacylglycerol kinase family enzyme
MCAATAFGTRVSVFVNASSGWEASEDAPAQLEHWFKEAGLETDIRFVEKGANLAEMAREAVASGSGIVVAAGGDGTLSATASGLVGTETVFGVLPVGTLNHFARDLHIPLDLEAAARVVIAGLTDYIDVGEVNGKTFLNNAILGLYPIYRFRRAENERRGWHGKLALVWAWAQVFARFRHSECGSMQMAWTCCKQHHIC